MSAHDDLREAEMDAALSDDPGSYADEIARLREAAAKELNGAAGKELQEAQAKLAASRKEAAEVKARITQRELQIASAGDPYDQMVALAEAEVKAGRARTVNQALAQVAVDRPDLWRRHVEQSRRSQRMKAAAAACAKADAIWGRVVEEAEGLVAAGRAPDIHVAIALTWKAHPSLYQEYVSARPR